MKPRSTPFQRAVMPPQRPAHLRTQRGVSLVTVLVMMLLSLLLVMGGSRVGLLNERVSGNSTDYQRAFEAAEALLADAKLDLSCMVGACGQRAAATQFTCDMQSYLDLQTTLAANNPPCNNGICNDLGAATEGNPATSFWNNAAQWAAYTVAGRGARFGQYTNTNITAAQAVNPLLVDRGWYWVEVLPYGSGAGGGRSVGAEQSFLGGQVVKPDTNCEFIFRITAAAQGRRPGTLAVLQSLYFFRPS